MALDKYARDRLVALRPNTTVYDAVRAMEDNHVGAVVVHDGEEVIGIVTDRDLALNVLGFELDPREIELGDLVSAPISALPVTASEQEAARMMADAHVRRLPVLDGTTLVGLVTLDDLLVEQALDPATISAIVRAQLSEPARLKPGGQTHPSARLGSAEARRERVRQRHVARAKLAYDRLVQSTQSIAELETPERAGAALEEVVGGIVRRLRPREASHLMAQLPRLLANGVATELVGPDRSVTRDRIEQAVARRLQVDALRASQIVRNVGRALGRAVSVGEIADLCKQLPLEMRDILTPPEQ